MQEKSPIYCSVCFLRLAPYDTKVTKNGNKGAHNDCLLRARRARREQQEKETLQLQLVWDGRDMLTPYE